MKNTTKLGILLVVLLGLLIVVFSMSFPILTENRTIEIYSETADYTNEEDGSWKITETGSWSQAEKLHVSLELDSKAVDANSYPITIYVFDASSSMVQNSDFLNIVMDMKNEQIPTLIQEYGGGVFVVGFDKQVLVKYLYMSNDNVQEQVMYGGVTNSEQVNYMMMIDAVEALLNQVYSNAGSIVPANVIIVSDSKTNTPANTLAQQMQGIKQQNPYINVSGISYNTNGYMLDELNAICDNNYIADTSTEVINIMDNILFNSNYEDFVVSEYINGDDFTIDQASIKSSIGLTTINNNTIEWDISGLYSSGTTATLEYDLIIKDTSRNAYKMFYTNTNHEIVSSIGDIDEDVESDETIVLNNDYSISFLPNTPSGCTVQNMPSSEKHHVGTSFRITSSEPTCSGYKFNGWKQVKDTNLDYDDWYLNDIVYMPDKNLQLIATWSRLNIDKGFSGNITALGSLYNLISNEATLDTSLNFANPEITPFNSGVYKMSSTQNDNYPIYYYHGDVDNNNVLIGDTCWRILRTTSTGGIKLIYNGAANQGTCQNDFSTTSINYSSYNLADDMTDITNNYHQPATSAGYMYDPTQYNLSISSFPRAYSNIYDADEAAPDDYYGTDANLVTRSYQNNLGSTSTYREYELVDPEYEEGITYGDIAGKYRRQYDSLCTLTVSCYKYAYYYVPLSGNKVGVLMYNREEINYNSSDYIVNFSTGYSYDDTNDIYLLDTEDIFEYDYGDVLPSSSYKYTCLNNSTTCEELYYIHGDVIDLANYVQILTTLTQDQVIVSSLTSSQSDLFTTARYVFQEYNASLDILLQIWSNSYQSYSDFLPSVVKLTGGQTFSKNSNVMLLTSNNTASSDLKETIDAWFYRNTFYGELTAQTKQALISDKAAVYAQLNTVFEDTVYCNDRSIHSDQTNDLTYNAYLRSSSPSLTCSNAADRFSMLSQNGNGSLILPVGTASIDEIRLTNWPEYEDSMFWTMSPGKIDNNLIGIYSSRGVLASPIIPLDVKPVVSLRPEIIATAGTGYANDPYVIDTTMFEGE